MRSKIAYFAGAAVASLTVAVSGARAAEADLVDTAVASGQFQTLAAALVGTEVVYDRHQWRHAVIVAPNRAGPSRPPRRRTARQVATGSMFRAVGYHRPNGATLAADVFGRGFRLSRSCARFAERGGASPATA